MAGLNALSIAADILRRMGRDIEVTDFRSLAHFRDVMFYDARVMTWKFGSDGKSLIYQTSHKRMRMHVGETFLTVTLYSPCFEQGLEPIFVCEIRNGCLSRAEVIPEALACVRQKLERLSHAVRFILPAIGEDAVYAFVGLTTRELLKLAAVGAAQAELDRRLVTANIRHMNGETGVCDATRIDRLITEYFPAHVREQRFSFGIDRAGYVTSLRREKT